MRIHKIYALFAVLFLGWAFTQCHSTTTEPPTASGSKADLGRKIFFDATLSNPAGQSCSSCHDSSIAFSDPNHAIVSPGVVPGLFGNRNAPSISYAQYFLPMHWSPEDTSYAGGLFLDGRVNTLEEQAQHPFLNHLEMNNSSRSMVIAKLKQASYFNLFQQIYGNTDDSTTIYNNIADAIATFERTSTFSKFSSKYDYYLNGQATLTAQEMHGMKLFNDSLSANCGKCHLSKPDPTSGKVLFTDMTYDNLGVPKNPDNPYYKMDPSENPEGANYTDRGLGAFLGNPEWDGFFKTPSLRNVAISGPYFHNGYFKTLAEVVHWYNVRDSATAAGVFPGPEVPGNADMQQLGHMHLSPQDEADIVAFIGTLSDGYK
ncbi:MAG TPA: cytochrome c peroxidase [Candidatus Kapabacteria bacterium]|nr:cytochrome c peroxidase [Candidatus Kapabacteria bacterium]